MLDRGVGGPGAGRRDRHDDVGHELLWAEGGRKRAEKHVCEGEIAHPVGGSNREVGPEREQHGGHVRRGVGMHDAAADRPEVAYLQVADPARALGDRLETGGKFGAHELAPRRQRPDVHCAVSHLDAAQVESGDVDDERRAGDAQLHDRDERLPAGDRLRIGLAEELEGVVDVRRARVPRRCGNHADPPAARIDSTMP